MTSFAAGHKLLVFGNGGSAADATHLAAEFVGRFPRDRRALPADRLADNAAGMTAIANDYGFAQVFARGVQAFGTPGDVVLGMTTSGRSENVLLGLAEASRLGCSDRRPVWCVRRGAAPGGRPLPCGALVEHTRGSRRRTCSGGHLWAELVECSPAAR